jgi:hypothetical protein
LFGRSEIAGMRDWTAARNHCPERDAFRREHEQRRAFGLRLRHAAKLRHLRHHRPAPSATHRPSRSHPTRHRAPATADPADRDPADTSRTSLDHQGACSTGTGCAADAATHRPADTEGTAATTARGRPHTAPATRARGRARQNLHEFPWSPYVGGNGDTRRRPIPRCTRGHHVVAQPDKPNNGVSPCVDNCWLGNTGGTRATTGNTDRLHDLPGSPVVCRRGASDFGTTMHRSRLGEAVSSDTPTSNCAQYWLPFATAASGSPDLGWTLSPAGGLWRPAPGRASSPTSTCRRRRPATCLSRRRPAVATGGASPTCACTADIATPVTARKTPGGHRWREPRKIV